MSASEKRSNRSQYHVVSVLQVAIIAFALTLAGKAAAFTQIFPPFTGGTDFYGVPNLLTLLIRSRRSVIGLQLAGGAHFLVEDPWNGTA